MLDRDPNRRQFLASSALPARHTSWILLAALLSPTLSRAQAVKPVQTPSPLIEPAPTTPRVLGQPAGAAVPPPPQPEPGRRLEPLPDALRNADDLPPLPQPKVLRLVPDTTGLVPSMPAVPVKPRTAADVATHVSDLIETIQDPEAEISLVVKRTKLIETRRVLTRIAIADPTVADVAALDDQPNSRLINLYGRKFGTTSLTLWDADNRPVTFLIRVTLDTRDLEARIRQAFPGALVYVRQAGPQIILEGQVPDAKTMSDVLQVVTMELYASGAATMAGGMGGAGGAMGGGMAGGMSGGMSSMMGGGGQSGSMTGTSTGTVSPYAIINRVHVPGPRQVMLHVKIAEVESQFCCVREYWALAG